jgi:hypothetical protein
MSDASTIASLATAGGTVLLALATFSATRGANRAARASERALNAGLRPVLFNARPQDPPQKVSYVDNHWVRLRDGLAVVQERDGSVYMAIALRNVASGLAVVHGWHLWPRRVGGDVAPPPVEEFRRNARDLYVPAGDVSFWQAAVRDPQDELHGPLCEAISAHNSISVEILYGDHDGGQRTITRFLLSPRTRPADEEPWLWTCAVFRHWNLDRADPR